MKTVILTIFILLCPIYGSYGFDGFAKTELGCFLDGHTGAFGMSVGTGNVIVNVPEKNLRTYNYTGFFHASNGQDIQGASSFILVEKSLPIGEGDWAVLMTFGTGFLYEVKDDEDRINADLKCEVGARFSKSLQAGLGLNYIPKLGVDYQLIYLTIGYSL